MRIDVPLRTAIAGIGGFAAAHHGIFAELEERGLARVVATCDPALDRLAEICQSRGFVRRGIRTYKGFDEMLHGHCGELDLGVVATPIGCHAPMHEALVRARLACYLEKPPTLDPEELRRMLAIEENAVVPTNVGFSFVHLPERHALKRRMLGAEFGALRTMSFLGLSQRAPSYFQRNNWAGKLMLGENLLLDSCLGNAMAHFVNNLLFFGNQDDRQQWSRPVEMASELYRANPIEGPDTIFAICRLDSGVELRLAATHACPNPSPILEEVMEFERATVTIRSANQVTIQRPGSPIERFSISGASLDQSVCCYLDFLRGRSARPAQTLRDCLGFVETNALFYLAAGQIHELPASALLQEQAESAIVLPDIERAGRLLVADAVLPSQAGYSWARPGARAAIEALPNLRQCVQHMRRDSEPGLRLSGPLLAKHCARIC